MSGGTVAVRRNPSKDEEAQRVTSSVFAEVATAERSKTSLQKKNRKDLHRFGRRGGTISKRSRTETTQPCRHGGQVGAADRQSTIVTGTSCKRRENRKKLGITFPRARQWKCPFSEEKTRKKDKRENRKQKKNNNNKRPRNKTRHKNGFR